MANHASAIKRNRQNERRRKVNRSNLTRLRTHLKKIDAAIKANDLQQAKSLLSPTISLLDKSIQKGVLHKNAAGRRKSRLMSRVNGLTTPQASS
ncbi:MAG: 30S ribosomal protein S20 [Acidobacteriota bacterium]